MATTVEEGFRTFLSRLTPTSGQVAAAAKHRATVESALAAQMTVRRFFQTGSFSNGTGVRSYSDVDYFASLADRPGSSTTALNRVRDVLAARFRQTPVHVRRPAVVVEFGTDGSEKYEVVPAYLKSGSADQRVYDIPGPNGGWIEAAPDAHLAYVRAVDEKHGRKAKPLVRFLKAWKYYRNVPISSFYLEMRTAAYANGEHWIGYGIDVPRIFNELQRVKLAPMNDPKGLVGRITGCETQAQIDEAWSKLGTAVTRANNARAAEEAGDIKGSFYWWDMVFDGHFPAYG